MRLARIAALAGITWAACCLPGCAFLHNFKPWKLQEWNRGPEMSNGNDVYFSVRDPIVSDVARLESPGIDRVERRAQR